jgi:hypothetical protein
MADKNEAWESAKALKVKGNTAFAQHDWPKAIDFYTQAIDVYDKDATFFSNRAQVRMRICSCNMSSLPFHRQTSRWNHMGTPSPMLLQQLP